MKFFMVIVAAVLLSACHSGDGEVRVSYRDHGGHNASDVYLSGFYLVDSLGINSEFHSGPYVIDPYIDSGIFEFYWYASGFGDYSVATYINDQPSLRGAERVAHEYCGIGESCDDAGQMVCEYSNKFTMGCGIDLWEAERNKIAIDYLFEQVPDTLYMSLELCDAFDCEVRHIPVKLY